jgi:hypothetical protein
LASVAVESIGRNADRIMRELGMERYWFNPFEHLHMFVSNWQSSPSDAKSINLTLYSLDLGSWWAPASHSISPLNPTEIQYNIYLLTVTKMRNIILRESFNWMKTRESWYSSIWKSKSIKIEEH